MSVADRESRSRNRERRGRDARSRESPLRDAQARDAQVSDAQAREPQSREPQARGGAGPVGVAVLTGLSVLVALWPVAGVVLPGRWNVDVVAVAVGVIVAGLLFRLRERLFRGRVRRHPRLAPRGRGARGEG